MSDFTIYTTVYCFLVKRPVDRVPWPTMFVDKDKAEAYPFRYSDVTATRLLPYDEPVNTEGK